MTTLLLGVYALIFALVISVPLAVRQAYKRDSFFDRAGSGLSFLFVSVPGIVLAPILTLIFINKNPILCNSFLQDRFLFGHIRLDYCGWFPRVRATRSIPGRTRSSTSRTSSSPRWS